MFITPTSWGGARGEEAAEVRARPARARVVFAIEAGRRIQQVVVDLGHVETARFDGGADDRAIAERGEPDMVEEPLAADAVEAVRDAERFVEREGRRARRLRQRIVKGEEVDPVQPQAREGALNRRADLVAEVIASCGVEPDLGAHVGPPGRRQLAEQPGERARSDAPSP